MRSVRWRKRKKTRGELAGDRRALQAPFLKRSEKGTDGRPVDGLPAPVRGGQVALQETDELSQIAAIRRHCVSREPAFGFGVSQEVVNCFSHDRAGFGADQPDRFFLARLGRAFFFAIRSTAASRESESISSPFGTEAFVLSCFT